MSEVTEDLLDYPRLVIQKNDVMNLKWGRRCNKRF
jgi:hypothetical protein